MHGLPATAGRRYLPLRLGCSHSSAAPLPSLHHPAAVLRTKPGDQNRSNLHATWTSLVTLVHTLVPASAHADAQPVAIGTVVLVVNAACFGCSLASTHTACCAQHGRMKSIP